MTKSKNIFEKIDPSEALQILKILSKEDNNIGKRVEQLFLEGVNEVDIEEIAAEILSDLDFIDVEELWDRSESNRYGYTDSCDAAQEMIEEVIEPHLEKMKRLHSLNMFYEEMRYCMGIISGLQQFENNSSTEFKDWAIDIAGNLADNILSEWENSCKEPKFRHPDPYIWRKN